MTTSHSEQTAPFEERDVRLLHSRRSSPTALAFDAALAVAFFVYLIFAEPDFFTFWSAIGFGILLLLMVLLAFHVNDEQRSLRKDLAAGIKVYCDGRISAVYTYEDGESSPTHRIDVIIDESALPLRFTVPQRVYEAVEEGQTVRIAYAPLSQILLELRTDTYAYIATNP